MKLTWCLAGADDAARLRWLRYHVCVGSTTLVVMCLWLRDWRMAPGGWLFVGLERFAGEFAEAVVVVLGEAAKVADAYGDGDLGHAFAGALLQLFAGGVQAQDA